MRTVSIRELKNNPSGALREAREAPVLVLNHGRPEALLVTVGEEPSTEAAAAVEEALLAVRDLAEQRGVRAVRALDRAARPQSHVLREQPAPYGSDPSSPVASQVALARLVGAICTLAAPRRISIAVTKRPGLRVLVDLDRAPVAGVDARLATVAAQAGVELRTRASADGPAPVDDAGVVVFDRADVPMGILDRLIAEGRASQPGKPGPIPAPVFRMPPGRSIAEEIIRDREESRW